MKGKQPGARNPVPSTCLLPAHGGWSRKLGLPSHRLCWSTKFSTQVIKTLNILRKRVWFVHVAFPKNWAYNETFVSLIFFFFLNGSLKWISWMVGKGSNETA